MKERRERSGSYPNSKSFMLFVKMSEDCQITIDSLIKDELEGKSNAIGIYDSMIWKIRTGYAIFIYGSAGIIVGLISKDIISFDSTTALSLCILISGFSGFALVFDYSFIRSKLRVVKYRDKLTELAFKKTKEGDLSSSEWRYLLKCLKNSGELKERMIWFGLAAFWRPIIYYAGTCLVCIATALILKP